MRCHNRGWRVLWSFSCTSFFYFWEQVHVCAYVHSWLEVYHPRNLESIIINTGLHVNQQRPMFVLRMGIVWPMPRHFMHGEMPPEQFLHFRAVLERDLSLFSEDVQDVLEMAIIITDGWSRLVNIVISSCLELAVLWGLYLKAFAKFFVSVCVYVVIHFLDFFLHTSNFSLCQSCCCPSENMVTFGIVIVPVAESGDVLG